jgi:hypothetical protein
VKKVKSCSRGGRYFILRVVHCYTESVKDEGADQLGLPSYKGLENINKYLKNVGSEGC